MIELPPFAEAQRGSRRLKIDDDGLGVSLELPAPAALAHGWAAPTLAASVVDWRRDGATVLRDGSPVALDVLRDALREALTELDSVPPTRPCRDLVQSLTFSQSPSVLAYWQDVARATRSCLRKPPREVKARRPGCTTAERVAAKADRDREAEVASARWGLEVWAHPDNNREPGRVAAPALYAEATEPLVEIVDDFTDTIDRYRRQGMTRDEALTAWADDAEVEGWPAAPRIPGPRVFRKVAEETFGKLRRSNGRDYYVITQTTLDQLAPEV